MDTIFRPDDRHKGAKIALGVVGTAVALFGGLVLARYRVCNASQYMVRTGLGIQDMLVSRTGPSSRSPSTT